MLVPSSLDCRVHLQKSLRSNSSPASLMSVLKCMMIKQQQNKTKTLHFPSNMANWKSSYDRLESLLFIPGFVIVSFMQLLNGYTHFHLQETERGYLSEDKGKMKSWKSISYLLIIRDKEFMPIHRHEKVGTRTQQPRRLS